MKQVCNKLGLNEEANESSVVRAIEEMQAKNKSSMEDLQARLNKKNEEMDALNKECEKLKAEMEENKKAKAKADEEAQAKLVADTAAKAKTEVANLVASGRIKNDAKIIEKWEGLFVKNFTETKDLADTLPINRKGADFKSVTTPAANASTLSAEAKLEMERNGIQFGSMEYENAIKLKQLNK